MDFIHTSHVTLTQRLSRNVVNSVLIFTSISPESKIFSRKYYHDLNQGAIDFIRHSVFVSQFLFTSYLTPIWHESLANSSFVNPRLQLIRFCVQLVSSCLLFLHRAVNVDSGLFLVPPVTNSVFGHSEYSPIENCSCVFSCL